MSATALHAARRAAELDRLAAGESVDVLVAGTGPLAAAAVLEAATRGLSACLVTPGDLAGGTACRPVPRVRPSYPAALGLRWLLRFAAPHLVDVQPRLYPRYRNDSAAWHARLRTTDGFRVAAGIPADLLPPARRIPAPEALAISPWLRRAGLRGGLLAFDGWVPEPGRLVLAACRTAAGHGARIVPHLPVDSVLGTGVTGTDAVTGAPCTIRARAVIRVPPPERLERWALVRGGGSGTAAVCTPEQAWYPLGAHHALQRPVLRDALATFDAQVPTPYRVRTAGGVVTVRGGCPVTARAAAQAAVDAAVRAGGLDAAPCVTTETALAGAVDRERMAAVDAPRRLVARYGTDAARITALGTVDPALGRELPGTEITAAEVVFAVRNEGALTGADVLDHRLGFSIERSAESSARVETLVQRARNGLQ